MDFDNIPYEDIQWGQRLGAGSFGSVYKGSYLGIDIAIKEVLPSTEYDVHKYFEREWRIMRECRHPNIVLFLGLSKAPEDDGRVFIISEYVPRGNLRQYILSPHPFPWRLRLSYATDVARAVAYLHARQCIHRDLKGENLLITSNERIKVTDFGFARITSRNEDEMRRMTYCGTDGYMSPEIINGLDFDLPTDVFSLGIIFIEIMSRRLVDSKTYTRQAPHFTPDSNEVHRRASSGCPPALIALVIHCTLEDPAARPRMPEVLSRLREIELDVLSRLDDPSSEHVGSIRLAHRVGKRAMPIFDGGDTFGAKSVEEEDRQAEEDALRRLASMSLDIDGDGASKLSNSTDTGAEGREEERWRTARWNQADSLRSFVPASSELKGHQRLLPSSETTSSFGSAGQGEGQRWSSYLDSSGEGGAGIVQTASVLHGATPAPAGSGATSNLVIAKPAQCAGEGEEEGGSTMTIKGTQSGPSVLSLAAAPDGPSSTKVTTAISQAVNDTLGKDQDQDQDLCQDPAGQEGNRENPSASPGVISQLETIPSLPGSLVPIARKEWEMPGHTVSSEEQCTEKPTGPSEAPAAATHKGAVATHRFTLVDQSSAPLINGKKLSSNFTSTFAFAFLPRSLTPSPSSSTPHKSDSPGGKDPASGRCAVCAKKLGARLGMQCDDCHLIVHVKCSHSAPRNCTG